MGKQNNSFISSLGYTFITQIIITILGIILLRIVSYNISEEGLGGFLVVRRFVGFIFPFMTLNLDLGMSRYISFKQVKAKQYFLISFTVITGIFIFLYFTSPIYIHMLTKLLFGDESYSSLIRVIIIFLYSNCFQLICSGYYRGKHDFLLMNIINLLFLVFALLPLILFFNQNLSTIEFLKYYYLIYGILAFVVNFIIIVFKENLIKSTHILSVKFYCKKFVDEYYKFFKYSFQRLPNSFLLSLIFFIPISVASSSISLKVAAYIGIIISIFRMAQVFVIPFNQIFLPKFSYYRSMNQDELIKHRSAIVIQFIFTLPLLCSLFAYFIAPEIIYFWFGDKYSIVYHYLKIISSSMFLFMGYVLIRGILDGLYEFPYTNIISLFGAVVTTGLSVLTVIYSWGLGGLTIAFGFGLISLGVTSIFIISRKLSIPIIQRKNIISLLWGLSVFILLFLCNHFLMNDITWLTFISKGVIISFVSLISLLFYIKLDYEWIDEIDKVVKFKKWFT